MKTPRALLFFLLVPVSHVAAGNLIFEGPSERGEGDLPYGSSTAQVDVYGDDFSDFAGIQVELRFLKRWEDGTAGAGPA